MRRRRTALQGAARQAGEGEAGQGRRRITLSYIAPICLDRRMRRPDKTEPEFFLLMVLIGVPFAWVVIRTVLALIGI